MKNLKVEKATAKLAYQVARAANQGCPWLFYQPKLPEKVKELKEQK